MFIHTVLFEIKPKEVGQYRKDSLMWGRSAKKARGFNSFHIVKRFGYRDQYASVYEWNRKQDHDRFMKEFHEILKAKSKSRVKVLGCYNLKAIDRLK